ncbi:MAG: exodeoxyribonuclease VII small subunit [Chloroflexota bacterium]|nr:exodeoxyribonuclease VII small subunit [Chloroflexota bacterium]
MPKSSSKKTETPVQDLTYEEALAELEEIVAALEEEQNQLDDAIKLFERGQALAARCSVLLEAAELKVKQVAGDDLIPFEDASE